MAQTRISSSTAAPREESPVAGGPQRSSSERSELERSGGTPASAAAEAAPRPGERSPAPDPEVVPKPRRRTFSAEYKLRILREADRCAKPGQVGALLRREGLYSSHLTDWGRLRDRGFLSTAAERRRGRKPKPIDPSAKRVAQLEREVQRLSEKLRKAEIIIDFQKKVQALLSIQDEAGTK
jgi:transposase-like protein